MNPSSSNAHACLPKPRLHKHSISPSIPSSSVLVRSLAAPTNPADINTIQGTYGAKPTFNSLIGTAEPSVIAGNEGLFEVVNPASSTTFQRGDWVVPAVSQYGTWRTHAVAEEDKLLKVDKTGLTPAQVAYWEDALRKATGSAEWKADLEKNYWSDDFAGSAQFRRDLEADYAAMSAVLTEQGVAAEAVPSAGAVGGGGAPGLELPGWAVALPERWAVPLRTGDPAVVGRIERGRCLLDLRCVPAEADDALMMAVLAVDAAESAGC